MKIKTNGLVGRALDWSVATARGLTIDNLMGGAVWAWSKDALTDEDDTIILFSPSRNWAQGGPIIESEWICADRLMDGRWLAAKRTAAGDAGMYAQLGTTPLIAAMRCFVASKLGDEVDVPEGLS